MHYIVMMHSLCMIKQLVETNTFPEWTCDVMFILTHNCLLEIYTAKLSKIFPLQNNTF